MVGGGCAEQPATDGGLFTLKQIRGFASCTLMMLMIITMIILVEMIKIVTKMHRFAIFMLDPKVLFLVKNLLQNWMLE